MIMHGAAQPIITKYPSASKMLVVTVLTKSPLLPYRRLT